MIRAVCAAILSSVTLVPAVLMAQPVGNAPRPLGMGIWIAMDDFPSDLKHIDVSGRTQFHLVIDKAGRVAACNVTGSSGFLELDSLTCDLVTRRARFHPATDAAGQPVDGDFVSAVRWINHKSMR